MNTPTLRRASVGALALLFFASTAASAQERGRSRSRDAQTPPGEARAVPRRGPAPAQSPQAPPPRMSQTPPAQAQPPAPRPSDRRDGSPPRVAPRPDARPGYDQPRPGPSYDRSRPSYTPRYEPRVEQRAVPRTVPRYTAPPYSGNYRAPYRDYRAPYGSYRTPYRRFDVTPFFRPYYTFRPRVRLSFGISIGYPFAYPTWYEPYVPRAYSFYRPGIAYGGISFDIEPYDAAVYVDGEYYGLVSDFSPYQAPLTLPAGRHHIDLDAPGYAPLSFEITVVPRQVIPYQGSLGR